MYDELLKRLDIMAEGATPVTRGRPYAIGDYWNVCEEAAAAIRDLTAKLEAVKPRPLAECGDAALVIRLNELDEPAYYTVFKYPNGKWLSHAMGEPWLETWPAIPLSALTALEKT